MPEISEFRAFGRDHLGALALLMVLGFLVVRGARRLPPEKSAWIGRLLGSLLLLYGVVMYAQKAERGELSWQYSLPLELCHWVLLACIVSLFRPQQLAAEIAYFWGLGGTLQATLTPDLGERFPSWDFIQFFWAHGGILLAIVFFIAGQRFRPRSGSVLRMLVTVNLYAALVGIIDFIFGWNYGYLCRKPSQPSLLDYLGPWPWYILSLEGIAAASFWILALPWRFLDRLPPRARSGSLA